MLRQVTTPKGIIEGVACGDPRITVFKGIPYAKPPVGELRWRAPQPIEPWSGVYKADTFAHMAWQNKPGVDQNDFYTKESHPTAAEYEMDEDCLYLNVWTPANSAHERLPVFYYVHGGGFMGGYSYELEFDGEKIAKKGVILVTVGYRTGPLGFLAHPELEDASQGNFGMLDQLAGMKWVRENIAAFGGDPDKITIGGQSAGGMAITAHMHSPMTKGVFAGTLMISNAGLNQPAVGRKGWHPLEEAQQIGKELFRELGVNSLEEARALPAEKITKVGLAGWSGRRRAVWCPVIDGVFLTENCREAILAGRVHDVPLMISCCQDEGKPSGRFAMDFPTPEDFKDFAYKNFGDDAEKLLAQVDLSTPEAFEETVRNEPALGFCIDGVLAYSKHMARLGRPVYAAVFDHDIPGDDAGSYHGSDLWFIFDSLSRCWRPFEGKHYDLARQVSSYFMNFVKTGDPNGCDTIGAQLPRWDKRTLDNDFILCFKDAPVPYEPKKPELNKLMEDFYLKV